MAREKSEWKVKLDELKVQLPKGFDGKAFRSCRNEAGTFDKEQVSKVCEEKKFKNKADAVYAFLAHKDTKPKGKSKRVKTPKDQEEVSVNLLSKKTYKGLSSLEIGKVITMLAEIQKERKVSDIAKLKSEKENIEKQLKELQGK